MRRSACNPHGKLGRACMLAATLLAMAIGGGPAGGYESAGLTLTLYADQEHPDFKYVLDGEPVKLILTVRNEAGQPIATERGYSQVELFNYIFITDPAGGRHVLGQADTAHKMPPPFFLDDKPWALAETLPSGWVRTLTIEDLRTFLPMTRVTSGWYTIEARQPFLRFSSSGQDAGLGLLGQLEHPENWTGTIKSKPIQIFIAPALGAQLKLSVVDASVDPPEPQAQVPVKVFKTEALAGAAPVDAWSRVAPVLAGTTNFEGLAVWEEGSPCVAQGSYTALASVKGGYRQDTINENDIGWMPGCSGEVLKEIDAGGQTGLPITNFSLFALNSLHVGASSVIHSGDVGARETRSGPWLDSLAEVSFGLLASVKPAVRVYGDTIFLARGAKVYDVYYNELKGRGTVLGKKTTPLTVPVAEPPLLKDSAPGTKNITVNIAKKMTLAPGAYKDVLLKSSATLNLTGGVYHFEDLTVGLAASVICSGPTEIRIKNRFAAGIKSYVGPIVKSTLTARDVAIHVGGNNTSPKALILKPLAAEVAAFSQIKANLFVPNGTLSIGGSCAVTGAFVANDIVIGAGSRIYLDSAF